MTLARAAGLSIVSVTDHDSVAGLSEARAQAAKLGLTFVPGIEISTQARYEQHILGYCIDENAPDLIDFCDRVMAMRMEREERTLHYLKGKGVLIDKADVRRIAPGTYVGRPHIAAAMVEAGYAEDIRDAFIRYLSTDDYRKIKRPKPAAKEGVEAIVRAGGVAVLAHPHSLHLEHAELDEAVHALKDMGLGGLECYYGTYSPEQSAEYRSLAEKYDLVVTGGSDFHGKSVKPDVEIGTGKDGLLNYNDLEIVDKLQRRTMNK
jgi:predicted metal-dependent phosphoesterase TrpH